MSPNDLSQILSQKELAADFLIMLAVGGNVWLALRGNSGLKTLITMIVNRDAERGAEMGRLHKRLSETNEILKSLIAKL